VRAFIFGAGAQGRVVLDILRTQNQYHPWHDSIQFLDDDEQLWGQQINGCSVVGGFDYALQQERATFEMVIALGNPNARLAIGERAREHSIPILTAVHPLAIIMSTVVLDGNGIMISPAVVVNCNARIGNGVLINTAAVVEHDCVLADGATVCPGVQLGSRVVVGRAAFIGTGAIVLPRVSIGTGAVIAAGSVVTKDVSPGALVQGMPARVVEQIDETFDWGRVL